MTWRKLIFIIILSSFPLQAQYLHPLEEELLQAVRWGSLSSLRDTIQRGANVNLIVLENGDSPLIIACRSGIPNIVTLLLSHGADVHHRNDLGMTPLLEASKKGRAHLVRQLLEAGAFAADENYEGESALDLAKQHKNQTLNNLIINAIRQIPTTATWKVLFLVFQKSSYKGATVVANQNHIALAKKAIREFPGAVRKLSKDKLAVTTETVLIQEPLQAFSEYSNGIFPQIAYIDTYIRQHPGFDSYFVLFKHDNRIPYIWAGLTHIGAELRRPGYSDASIDIMEAEANRPYEVLVHEWGHQIENFYGYGNVFDHCHDTHKIDRCGRNDVYPEGSLLCCYAQILGSDTLVPRFSQRNIMMMGTPTNPRGSRR